MSKFLRFFGIFCIACACMFCAHSAVADTTTITVYCNSDNVGPGSGTVRTVTRDVLANVNCEDYAKNGFADGTAGTTRCDTYTLPTRAESGCSAVSGKDIIGWRAGNTLWMFKPGDRIAVNGEDYSVQLGTVFTAVWGKTYGSGANAVTVPFELTTTNLSGKKFTITIAAKGSYTVYCDLDNGTSHKASGPSSQSNNAEEYVCSYNDNSPKRIGITGTIAQERRNVFHHDKPAIQFVDTSKIATISGSLGAVFNSSWAWTFFGSSEIVAPSFAGLFNGAVNLTSQIPANLFAGAPTNGHSSSGNLSQIAEAIMGLGMVVVSVLVAISGAGEAGFWEWLGQVIRRYITEGPSAQDPSMVQVEWGEAAASGASVMVAVNGVEMIIDGIKQLTSGVSMYSNGLVLQPSDGAKPNELNSYGLKAKYYQTFKDSGVTGAIPDYLFGTIMDVASAHNYTWDHKNSSCANCKEGAFAETFYNCSGLTSIPDNLFGKTDASLYYLPRTNAYRLTFNGCTGLTSIPAGLFKNATGYAVRMFEGTFKWCYGLMGPIPEDLFANVGSPTPASDINYETNVYTHAKEWWDGMFSQTFYECSHLGGVWNNGTSVRTHFVPPDLFGTKSGRWSNNPSENFMEDIFYHAGKMAITCPSGYTEFVTGFRPQWANGTGSEKVISCKPTSSGNVTPYTVTLNPSPGSGGTSAIYQVYQLGWSKTNSNNSSSYVPSTDLSAISVPNYNGYEFLGYHSVNYDPITPTGFLNTDWNSLSGLKIRSNGKLVNMAANLTGPTTWYATWVQRCENLTYSHGTCQTFVDTNGRYKYELTCDTGYMLSEDGQSCVSDGTIYTFTLDKTGETGANAWTGTGGTNGPLYEKRNVGWSLNQSATSWTPWPTLTVPSHSGFTFVGYAQYVDNNIIEESDGISAVVNYAGTIGANPVLTSDGVLHAVWARNCDTATATQYHATCTLIVPYYPNPYASNSMEMNVKYETSCDTGYEYLSGEDTYQPKCQPKSYSIYLSAVDATSPYSYGLWATYNGNVFRLDDNPMTTNANPISRPVRVYNISYNKQGDDATLATLTDSNTKGTATFNGFYSLDSGGTQYINGNGYITSDGLDVGTHNASGNALTWYAQWTLGTVTLPTVTRPGYSFGGWWTRPQSGGVNRGTAGQTYTPQEDETLYARWTPLVYNFVFNDNNSDDPRGRPGLAPNSCDQVYLTYGSGWGVPCSPRSGDEGSSPRSGSFAMEQLPTRSGYIFGGYYVTTTSGQHVLVVDSNGDFVTNQVIPSGTSPYSLNASWASPYQITLNPNGGSGGASILYESLHVGFSVNPDGPFSSSYVIPNASLPTKQGFSFAGYWTSASGGTQVVSYVSGTGWRVTVSPEYTNNSTIWYAHWTPSDLTITLNDNGGSGGLAGTENANCTSAGLHYGNSWYNICAPTGGGGGNNDRGTTGSGDGGITLQMYSLPERDGYRFAGYWTQDSSVQIVDADGNFSNAYAATHALTTNGTIYAHWVANGATPGFYTITLNPNARGQDPQYIYEESGIAWYHDSAKEYRMVGVYPNIFDDVCIHGKDNVTCMSVTRPTAPANMVFDGYWTLLNGGDQIIDEEGTLLVDNSHFSSSTTLYAHWISANTTVTLNPNGGTLNPNCTSSTVTATYGSAMPAAATCSASMPGYEFLGYYKNDDATGSHYYDGGMSTNNMDVWDQTGSTATIYAGWSPARFTVDYKCSDSGSVVYEDAATMDDLYKAKVFSGSSPDSVGCTLPNNKVFVGWAVSHESDIWGEGQTSVWSYTEDKEFIAQLDDAYRITLVHGSPTNSPAPSVIYLKPNNPGKGWYSDSNLTTEITGTRMATVPEKTGFTFDGYWNTDASSGGVQVIDSRGYFKGDNSALGAYSSSGYAYARWIGPEPDFVVTTTPMSANDTFKFVINATGTFIVDWGDGEYSIETGVATNPILFEHTYKYASSNGYQIGVSGPATAYNSSSTVAAISFSTPAADTTPQYVAGISGSLGAAFPSISGTSPVFYNTFKGCSNLASISGSLFVGVTGARANMFNGTFEGCTSLVTIPASLFSGVSGMANGLFMNTFKGCTGITRIPTGLFTQTSFVEPVGAVTDLFNGTFDGCWGITSSIPATLFANYTGANPTMFKNTFRNCSNITGSIPATLFSSVTDGAEGMFYGTFQGCSGLSGTIPSTLFANISTEDRNLFAHTFQGCSGLSGTLPQDLFANIGTSANGMFDHTFYGCSGLEGWIPERMFGQFEGQDATDFMTDIFANSGLVEECPGGMIKYEPEPLADYWDPKVSCVDGPAYRIALNANGGTVVSGTTTEMIYEKYGTASGSGWGLSTNGTFYAAPTNPTLLPIVPPTRTNYTFDGYYDSPNSGEGSRIIDSTGSVLMPATHFSTYNSNPSEPDATLYAHWTPLTYTITYNMDGGDTVPSGYDRVLYVSNGDNTTKIATGIRPTVDNVEMIVRYYVGSTGSLYLLNTRPVSGGAIYGISGSVTGNTIIANWNGSTLTSAITRTVGHTYYIKASFVNGNMKLYVLDETTGTSDTKTGTYTFAAPSTSLYLFGNDYNYTPQGNGILGATVFVNNSRVMNYIPVRNGNNIGFYNTVSSGNFVSASSSGSSGSLNAAQVSLPTGYTYGDTTNIIGVPTRAHATFNGWCPVVGGVVQTNQCAMTQTISSSDSGNKEFKASWTCDAGYTNSNSVCTANTLTLNYSVAHGTQPSSQTCQYDSTIQLRGAVTDATGYLFNKWSVNSKNFSGGATVRCTTDDLGVTSGSVTLTATWTTNSYNCEPGEYLPAAATSCSVCTAGNWCPGGGFDFDASNDQGINPCPTGYGDGGTGLSAQNQCAMNVSPNYYVATANAATATACATGHNSVGGLVTYGTTTSCDPNEITITFTSGGHTGVTAPTSPSSCTYGGNLELPAALVDVGYTFDKWSVAGGGSFNAGTTIVCNNTNLGVASGSVTINATWTANPYNITYEFNGGLDPRNISGYTPVDYIESDGANYINIGVPANILIDWAEITYKQLANASGQTNALFGNYNDASTGYNFILSTIYANTSGSRLRSYNLNNSTFTTVPDNLLSLNTWYTLGLDTRNRLLINESAGLERPFTPLSTYAATAHSIPLFAGNCNGTVGDNSTGMPCGFTQMRLRDFALYEATSVWGADYSIKFHGIPMRRNSDNVCGLLNVVPETPVFRTSAVTGHPMTCPNTVSYPATYTHGTATTIASAPTRPHSRFVGWCTDSALNVCGDPITISAASTGDITLRAKWECNVGFVASGNACVPQEYTITLDNANATTNGTSQLYAVYAEGVYTDAAHTHLMATNANPITKPVRQYTVTYNPGAGTVSPTSSVSTYTFTSYANAGGNTVINGSSGLINTTGILFGRRLAGTYTGSSSSERTWTANWNSTNAAVTLPLPFRSGYLFDGWYNGDTSIGDNGESYTPTADITLTAHWNQCGHTAGAHSSITNTTTSNSNECVYTVTCDTGYSLNGGTDSTTEFEVTTNEGIVSGTLPACVVRTFTASYVCEDTYDGDFDEFLHTWGSTYTKDGNSYTITNVGTGYRAPIELPNNTYTISIDSISFGENTSNPRIEVGTLSGGTFTRVGWVGSISNTVVTSYTGEFNAIRLNHTTNNSGYTVVNPMLRLATVSDGVVLPAGYKRLEYIATNGAQYIDTGITANTTTKVDADVSFGSVSGVYAIIGVRNGDNTTDKNVFQWGAINGKTFNRYGMGGPAGANLSANTLYNVHVENGLQSVFDGNTNVAPSTFAYNSQMNTANTLYMFCTHDTTQSSGRVFCTPSGTYIKHLKITKGGSVVRDFIPVMNDSGVVGMYDTVSKAFFGNLGSGTFTAGPVIGVSGNPPASHSVTYGTKPTLPAAAGTCARTGYTLSGWRADGTLSNWVNGVNEWTYTTNKRFVAQWTPNTITLQYVTAHGTAPSSVTCPYGQTRTLAAAPNAPGYTFGKWRVNGAAYDPGDTITCDKATLGVVSGTASVTATWTFAPTFTVTVNMPADLETKTFKFNLGAKGNFVVDWGDGSAITDIARANANDTEYSHTYANAGTYTIRIGGRATAYNSTWTVSAIRFFNGTPESTGVPAVDGTEIYITGITGSLSDIFPSIGQANTTVTQPRFFRTFRNAKSMAALPANLFTGLTGAYVTGIFRETFYDCSSMTGTLTNNMFGTLSGAPQQNMFYATFAGCSNLTSTIPAGVFGAVNGNAASYMFYRTFHGCSKLNGSIPSGLFGTITGSPQLAMYAYTFTNCSNLTGSIPSGLFGTISGSPQSSMYSYTFSGCSNLTGSIPSGLFGNIVGAPADYMYSNTFANCSKLTGQIPSGLFGQISGDAAQQMYYRTFYNCSSLDSTIPSGLFGAITGEPKPHMFRETFAYCTGVHGSIPIGLFGQINGDAAVQMYRGTFMSTGVTGSIPSGLFGTLTGTPQPYMFYATFYNCPGLTGPIPDGLFGQIDGDAAEYMYYATFWGCSGLTGVIPNGLFGELTGTPQQYMFYATFRGCTNLVGYVPTDLFGDMVATPSATGMMDYVFYNSGLATQCPCGTTEIPKGQGSPFNTGTTWSGKVECEIGVKPNEHWYNNQCVTDCATNVVGGNSPITKLKTSNGLEYAILSTKPSNKALNFRMANDAICYAPLETGASSSSMNFKDSNSGTIYHMGTVSSVAPAGWDPQALAAAGQL